MRKRNQLWLAISIVLACLITIAEPQPTGDDLFPWPHGVECPIPWMAMDGLWKVQSSQLKDSPTGYLVAEYMGVFEGFKYLKLYHYDFFGVPLAEGYAISSFDDRNARGVLTLYGTETTYLVSVRSFSRENSFACTDSDFVMSVAFCPTDKFDCSDKPASLLEKLD